MEPALLEKADFVVVYRDEHWLAVDKPAGLLVHPGADKSRPDLVSAVSATVVGELTLHHRLDAETSGLVLFSLSALGRTSVAAQFEQRQVEKGYVCRIAGHHPASWSCDLALGERRGRVSVDPAGKSALTEFRTLEKGIIEARPTTGRKHQIRVHLASQGRPIVGDKLYGGPAAPRLMLHAHWLRLRHPDGEMKTLIAPIPPSFRGA
jgi:RluA family pseudouridine synthase